MTDQVQDVLDVVAYFEHELAHQDTVRRVVDGYEQEVVDEVVTHLQEQKMTVDVEPRDTEKSFWIFVAK